MWGRSNRAVRGARSPMERGAGSWGGSVAAKGASRWVTARVAPRGARVLCGQRPPGRSMGRAYAPGGAFATRKPMDRRRSPGIPPGAAGQGENSQNPALTRATRCRPAAPAPRRPRESPAGCRASLGCGAAELTTLLPFDLSRAAPRLGPWPWCRFHPGGSSPAAALRGQGSGASRETPFRPVRPTAVAGLPRDLRP